MRNLLLIPLLLLAINVFGQKTIDLSGEWMFRIDRNDIGEKDGWYKPDFSFDEKITLPASMPERMKGDDISVNTQWVGALYDSSYFRNPYMEKYRVEGQMKLPFFLTPAKHYVGKAWYKRTVTIDDVSELPMYALYLERPHIISEVWVNGEKVKTDDALNSLSVPHVHYLFGYLRKGENTIAICIDNDPDKVCVGKDSHSVTDQTQGCWNGMVGRIELQQASYIENVKVYPDVDRRKADVLLLLNSVYDDVEKGEVMLTIESFNTAKRHIIVTPTVKKTLRNTIDSLWVTVDMGDEMLLWDEFAPQMYRLTAEVKTKGHKCQKETYFGMRKIDIRDKMFYVNGKEVQLRGNVENCVFPNTGYPPTDLDSWLKIFERYKEFGINHVRFHSYCPPEAAFLAADLTGLYIQPEGPSWPNHGVRLGRGEYIDTYLYDEALAIVDEYGNHPSFTFFAFGNEPAGNWVSWCNKHVPLMQAYDARHIYAGFSVGGGWAWQPKSEFAVKAGARGLNEWVNKAPESMADFADKISVYNGKDMPGTPITVPFVTHEMGQWCVFPNFDEIAKYTGVNKARNFEIFQDLLKENGMESRGKKFMLASGKLQTLCYKYEIERILRTPKYAGFQILSLNDYTGQGTALVGVTDAFYGDKGYVTPKEWREFCSAVVPLAKFPKFTYANDETFSAELSVNNFSGEALPPLTWQMTKADGSIVAEGKGNEVSVALNAIDKAQKLTLRATVGKEGTNHWDVWVYPKQLQENILKIKKGKRIGTFFADGIYVTDSLDAEAQKQLKKGGKVLICAAGKVTYGREVKQQFTPVFWNTSWFKMRPPHTTGILVENEHPVFADFPTDYHSDLQWWELVNKAQVMQFTDFPKDFQPLVQSIDTWFVSRKIGMLFEAKVGNGKLMMTTMDIAKDLDKRLAARQMRKSIIDYMKSDAFTPQFTVEEARIADLFTKIAGEVNMFTNDSPDELKPKLK